MFVGMACGFWPPLAHEGVPHSVIITSRPRCCAFLTTSSTSSNRYAGSNGSVASVGRVGAAFDQSMSVRTTEAPLPRARSIASVRPPSKRSTGSSWKPTHMRSAADAAGATRAAVRQARTSKRTTNRTRTSLGGVGKRAR
jgi:hypothetical protein